MKRIVIVFLLLMGGMLMSAAHEASAQEFTPNYDESQVPGYTLPDVLTCLDGTVITSSAGWEQRRRREVLTLFAEHMFGHTPSAPTTPVYDVSVNTDALGGTAIRKQVRIMPFGPENRLRLNLLIYLPKTGAQVPVFLGLNFKGNHTIHPDPGIDISQAWIAEMLRSSPESLADIDASRGVRINRWPVKQILERGYGLATMYYYDIDPDYDDGFHNGVHPYFYKVDQTAPTETEWGSIGAWAWGLSRAMDYLQQDSAVDSERVFVMGHSRLGKASLWAGAQDTRFAMVISNNSGCGGAALSRRAFGETVGRINRSFPHWFNDRFNHYNENESVLPLDQHMLVGLIAPRPVYVASAEEDRWADPRGEFLAAKHAGDVYALYSMEGVGVDEMPETNTPVGDRIGYHIRNGKHDVTGYDWQRWMDFADRHFSNRSSVKNASSG